MGELLVCAYGRPSSRVGGRFVFGDMMNSYIAIGAAKVAEERQLHEVAGQISLGYTRTRSGVDSAGRLPGVTASRSLSGKSMRRNRTKTHETNW